MNQDNQTIQARKDAEYLETIKRRHDDRQNTARQLRLRQLTLENVSYFFNAGSILSASYFAYSITANYAGIWKWTMLFVLIGVLIFIELSKRYTTSEGAEGKLAWLVLTAALVAVSFYVSYEGGERFTVEQAVGPVLEKNPAIDSMNQRISAVNADIVNWKQQTWKGKIVTDARRSIAKLEQTKIGLIEQRAQLENRDLTRNDGTEQAHQEEVKSFGIVFGVVAGFMDVLLVVCLFMAKGDEQDARRLLGLTENVRESVRAADVRERSRERERPNEKPAVFVPVPANAPTPTVNRELTEYAQRTGQQIADLKQMLDAERAERERIEKEMAANVRANEKPEQIANVKTEQPPEQKQPRTPNKTANKNKRPKWVDRAKRMRENGMSFDAIAKQLKKAKSTVHKWVNE